MNGTLYAIAGGLLVLSFLKDRKKSMMALKKAYKSLLKNMMMLIGMMVLMGVVFSFVNVDLIGRVFGSGSGIYGILLGLGIGVVSFIPSFIAFPLGATLIENGAGYAQVAGFISSLMGVGIVSLPMEIEYFGKKAAILRNIFAIVASVLFIVVIGGLL
ncbi:hypothetical protein SANA_13770 [Gottschalkiaceae bacterium SANA]|nr:hypothetical protein SANA_13770 [Gottschalkiaceae bacterium SANA]